MPAIDFIGRVTEILDAGRSNVGTKVRTVWYVDSGIGNDNYDGLSRAHPFATIGAAVTAASAGDTIHIARGNNYDEAVSIPAGLTGLEVLCEPGVAISNTTPGTVVTVAAPAVRWKGGLVSQWGQIGFSISGAWFIGKDMLVDICTIGFQLTSTQGLYINCKANQTTTSGWDIANAMNVFIGCNVNGDAASRGFYLSHTNAHENILARCATLGCTAAGYECVAGADDNLFDDCSQSSLCAGPTNAGANNTFANHKKGSQITAGNSVQDDLAHLNTRQGRVLCSLDFWSLPQEEVAVTNVAGDKSLPDVVVAGLPAGATIVRAITIFKFRMVQNTNVAANKLDGAQEIQVRDDSPSAWIDAINFVDDMFSLEAEAREGGDAIIGAIDVSATVDGNDTYNFQWDEALADLANINFNDIQVGIRIWFSI